MASNLRTFATVQPASFLISVVPPIKLPNRLIIMFMLFTCVNKTVLIFETLHNVHPMGHEGKEIDTFTSVFISFPGRTVHFSAVDSVPTSRIEDATLSILV